MKSRYDNLNLREDFTSGKIAREYWSTRPPMSKAERDELVARDERLLARFESRGDVTHAALCRDGIDFINDFYAMNGMP